MSVPTDLITGLRRRSSFTLGRTALHLPRAEVDSMVKSVLKNPQATERDVLTAIDLVMHGVLTDLEIINRPT